MNKNSKTSIAIGLAVGILVILFIVIGAGKRAKAPDGRGSPRTPSAPETAPKEEKLPTVEGGTRAMISETITAPEPGATSSGDVAVPISSIELKGASATAALRTFEMKAEKNTFTPATIVVNELDVIEIKFTAVDKDYSVLLPDFGVYRKASAGETVKIQFQAYPFGEYTFLCSDVCAPAVQGKFIVNKRS